MIAAAAGFLRRIAVALCAAVSFAAQAGGPLELYNHQAVVYPNGGTSLTLNLDQGSLGTRTNAQAVALVQNAIALWNGVGTSTMRFKIGPQLSTDYTTANYTQVLSNYGDGLNPVLFDTDGTITNALFGAGARNNILGFAGSAYFTSGPSAGNYVEGEAVLNGFLSISDATFTIVMAHEFGHFFGLDHSQLDSAQGLAQSNYVLMYPIAYRTLLSLHEDDIAADTSLYPAGSAGAAYGQLTGAFTTAGGAPILGANIWAKENTTGKVYSVVSDFLTQGNGYFRLFLPAGTYTLHAESIDSGFTGGSGVGPYASSSSDISFQPPNPITPVALGGGTPQQVVIIAGCLATAAFHLDGSGSVTGNCAPTLPTSTTTVTSSKNPSSAGATVTFTASVTGAAPTGGVGFSDGGTTISGCGAVALTGSGSTRSAVCSTSALSVGSHTIGASYVGDAGNSGSQGSLTQTVQSVLTATTTTLVSSASPSAAGTTVTFTATVSGAAPTGSVGFSDGGTTLSGCGAVALTGSGNARSAACSSSALTVGAHSITASYGGDAGNQASSSTALSQTVVGAALPGTGTVVANPYGVLTVQGATLVGSTLSNLQPNVVIQLGPSAGTAGSFAEIDFQGFSWGPGTVLTVRSGAAGQTLRLANTTAEASAIGGAVVAQAGTGAAAPALYLRNPSGFTIAASGSVSAPSGLTLDALGSSKTTGQDIVNAGSIDGGAALTLYGANIKGGGAYKGNAMVISTFGSANNPVNGAHYLANGLQLFPSSGSDVLLSLNDYGTAAQFFNVLVNGNAHVAMPSAWPSGVTLPPNNPTIPPGGMRAAGVPDPSYGASSIIVQATGTLSLSGGASNDFVFAGGIALKSQSTLDLSGVIVDQGWTTSGQAFQGTFFESPNIVSSGGNIQVLSNNLNWVNFSTLPHAPVRTWSLVRAADGSAQYVTADSVAPHLNTYSLLIEAAANGQCWTCIINNLPVNMF